MPIYEEGESSQQARVQIDPELYQAASSGDVRRLINFLESTTQQDGALGVTHTGDTALHIATLSGHINAVRYICDKVGNLLTQSNDKGETPLHYAAQAGNSELVATFISYAKISGFLTELLGKKNLDGETALYQAINHCQVLDNNDHFHENFVFFQLRIRIAVVEKEEKNAHEVVKKLLQAESDMEGSGLLQPAIADNTSISPLYLAIMKNSLLIVTSLIERLKKWDEPESATKACSGPDGRTALHAAALKNKVFIKKVVEWKPELTKTIDKVGSTPLHYAASANNLEAVEQLLKTDKKSAYIADASGLYPIHVAAKLGWELLVAEFFKQCPDSNKLLDPEGRNFLHQAVEQKKESVVRWVCERSEFEKAMNSQDNEGNTPMHLAVKAQNVKIFSILLGSKMTRKSIMNKNGWTPLDVAEGNKMIGLFHMQHPKNIILRNLQLSGCPSGIHRRDHLNLMYNSQILPEEEEKEAQNLENMARSMAVGSTLIASATFAGAFAVSTEYINSQAFSCHRNPGLSLAFKTFILMDAFAFICAMTATALVVHSAISYLEPTYRKNCAVVSSQFVTEAIRSFIVAFALGVLVMMDIVSQWRFASVVCLIFSVLLVFPQPDFLSNISVQKDLLVYLGIPRFIMVGGFGFFSNISYAIIVLLVLFAGRLGKTDFVEHILLAIIIVILFFISSPIFLPYIGCWKHRSKFIKIMIEKKFFFVILLSLVTCVVLFFPFDHLKKSSNPHKCLLLFLVFIACALFSLSFAQPFPYKYLLRKFVSVDLQKRKFVFSSPRELKKFFLSNSLNLLMHLVLATSIIMIIYLLVESHVVFLFRRPKPKSHSVFQ
ncbi:Ankyrin repeat protein family-like protein [Rhynchospora pubera]|uniref:Ankyrin repeat protein family-like protein n=1 Tax=Rhynchospora pubera TaxID=906938 RepID=A0AAV8F5Z4_9POAL|nr:Ankyrin repeat protein family-like protein [Rhynchospora pubera]